MSNKTLISIPGSREQVDLLKIPVHRACAAINAWHRSREIFTEDFQKTMIDNEPGWTNAHQRLLELGRAILDTNGNIIPTVKTKKGKAA